MKGLLSNLIETFIERIESDNSKIKAWIGPSISAKNYEVGREVYELFIEKDTSSQSSFTPINKARFDLQMEAIRILDLRNISSENSDICRNYDSEKYVFIQKESNYQGISNNNLEKSMSKIGFIGFGVMGFPMAGTFVHKLTHKVLIE